MIVADTHCATPGGQAVNVNLTNIKKISTELNKFYVSTAALASGYDDGTTLPRICCTHAFAALLRLQNQVKATETVLAAVLAIENLNEFHIVRSAHVYT